VSPCGLSRFASGNAVWVDSGSFAPPGGAVPRRTRPAAGPSRLRCRLAAGDQARLLTVGVGGATYIFQLSRVGWSDMGFPSWCVDYRRWAGPGGRTRSSWLRELMASLAKTLLRWYGTVRALRNSRAAISGLDRPSRASRPAPLRECFHAHLLQHLVSGTQLPAVPGTAQVADRLAAKTVSGLSIAEQRANAGFHTQRPVGGRNPRALGQPLQCGPDQPYVTRPGRRLGRLGHDKATYPAGHARMPAVRRRGRRRSAQARCRAENLEPEQRVGCSAR
jgi:hypothetical protein